MAPHSSLATLDSSHLPTSCKKGGFSHRKQIHTRLICLANPKQIYTKLIVTFLSASNSSLTSTLQEGRAGGAEAGGPALPTTHSSTRHCKALDQEMPVELKRDKGETGRLLQGPTWGSAVCPPLGGQGWVADVPPPVWRLQMLMCP